MLSVARHRSGVALAVAAVLIVGALLAACGGGQPAPAPTQVAQAPAPTQAAPTQPPTQAPPTNPAILPTVTAVPTATTAPTLAPTATSAPATTQAVTTTAPAAASATAADAASCVKCHTDEAALQKLAKAEEPKESLSEGEG